MHDCLPLLQSGEFPAVYRSTLDTLQVNLGYLCNQTCSHCHVNAGPRRTEIMDAATIADILSFARQHSITTLDLTGGAPEMNPLFRSLVSDARKLGIHVIDRCNLTILMASGFEWLAEFLAENDVEVVASLPCYLAENVDRQRGSGVFKASLAGLQRLNDLGYGKEHSGLLLQLVYNPSGACLPPSQQSLEDDYKQQLHYRYGIEFNHLFTITNVPIKRFGSSLISQGIFESYMQTLKQAYQADNSKRVMCRNLISIDWQGYVYDCDFNQMLGLNIANQSTPVHISDLLLTSLQDQAIAVLDHCYACTAGQGSSCGGAL